MATRRGPGATSALAVSGTGQNDHAGLRCGAWRVSGGADGHTELVWRHPGPDDKDIVAGVESGVDHLGPAAYPLVVHAAPEVTAAVTDHRAIAIDVDGAVIA